MRIRLWRKRFFVLRLVQPASQTDRYETARPLFDHGRYRKRRGHAGGPRDCVLGTNDFGKRLRGSLGLLERRPRGRLRLLGLLVLDFPRRRDVGG